MPMRSAKAPSATGMIAPPTMAATSNPDPLPVKGPSPAIPRVKILGNITELNSPTRMMLYIARCPKVSIDTVTRANAAIATAPSSLFAWIFCKTAEPMKRPIMAKPQ